MRCDEARDRLWPPDRPGALTPELLAARRHVESCEACREYLSQDQALLRAHRVLRAERAPGVVRSRIFDGLEGESGGEGVGPTPSRGSGWKGDRTGLFVGGFALAAVALVLVPVPLLHSTPERETVEEGAPAVFLEEGSRPAPYAAGGSAFVEDFLRRAVQMERIATDDPGEVVRFLAGALGARVAVPRELPGARLAGAEVCIVEGERGVVVIYRSDLGNLYHYILPPGEGPGNRRPPAPSEVTPLPWSDAPLGPAVVTWNSRGMEEALVAEMDPGELLRLAEYLAY